MDELSLSLNTQLCAGKQGSIVAIGNVYNDIRKRPGYIYA